VLDIIAYLRTLQPIVNDTPDHKLDFPLNYIVNSIPKAAEPRTVNHDDPVEYGGYLAQMAGCTWCHTPTNATQQSIPDELLAGGHEFVLPNTRTVRSANISSDKTAGIGNWTREQFIARFRVYQGEAANTLTLGEEGHNTLMSWTLFADMKDEDLGAIYAYLMASEPRAKKVAVWD